MTIRTIALALIAAALAGNAPAQEAIMARPDFEPLIGGCGGVYFMAEPGELVVEVLKRDRNTRSITTELRALLVGPDRQVLQEAFIPTDDAEVGAGLGPPQTARLSTSVERPGIYALNITVSNDRYGDHFVWGFRTNCPRYIIETARGHRDQRHEEPIVLASPEQACVIAFQPRAGEFSIELSRMPAGSAPAALHAADGTLVGILTPDAEGASKLEVPANVHRDATPWELRLPVAQAIVSADGLTRWEADDPIGNACLWTPDPASWFPLIENRWLLTPYGRLVYGEPGARGEISLRAHNNATAERDFTLTVEYPGAEWPVQLEPAEVTLGGNEAASIRVAYTIPEGDGPHVAHLRITPEDAPQISTYSTLTVRPGHAPAERPLTMPLELQPYAHENEQFGYLPDYPLTYQPCFAPDNRPYMRTAAGIATWRDGQWSETNVNDAVVSRPESFEGNIFGLIATKVSFDADGGIYLPANCAGRNAILHSADGGLTFAAYEVPGARGSIDIEHFTGHNVFDGPPAFVRFRRTASDPNLKWRSLNDLELFVPRVVNGAIRIGEPLLITRDCIGFSTHSGAPTALASRGDLVHVTWGEATDPQLQVPGVPTYVATFNRRTGEITEPALIGYGPPANDAHNSPSITMDSDGAPHVLVGTHGRPFQHSQRLADGSWTEPLLSGEGLSQTYIGMVCGPDDTLHVVFRLWRSGEPFPNASHATLAYQRKRPGQPWEEPRILVRAPFSEYSVFYHRLMIDREGRLFISYDYWSTHWFYRNDHVGNRRAVIMSPDGGETWKMAETRDLAGG
ncbi:MAG: hypothetical protein GX131_09470 [candidate division WS1 bacterium]|jgi:hypothetical protein|nr:hypothetical protein [candidate division WS1 bacterium]